MEGLVEKYSFIFYLFIYLFIYFGGGIGVGVERGTRREVGVQPGIFRAGEVSWNGGTSMFHV